MGIASVGGAHPFSQVSYSHLIKALEEPIHYVPDDCLLELFLGDLGLVQVMGAAVSCQLSRNQPLPIQTV